MLTERKLTEREVESREVVLKGLLKNKRNLVKKYGKDAEQVMYGIATKKAKTKVEGMNKDKIRELIYKTLTREDNDPSGADLEGDPNEYVVGEGHGLDQGDLDLLKQFVDSMGFDREPVDAKDFSKLKRILQFIIKSNILQDKTKDLSKGKVDEVGVGVVHEAFPAQDPAMYEAFLTIIGLLGAGAGAAKTAEYLSNNANKLIDWVADNAPKYLGKVKDYISKKVNLAETVDQEQAVYDLRDIVERAEELGDEARQIVRQYFPNEMSRMEGYGVFNLVYSNNRYDTTLGSEVDRLEGGDYDDLDDEDYPMQEDFVNEKMLPLIKKSLAKAPKADKVAKKKKMKLPSGMVNYMDFTKSVAEKLTKKHKVGDFVDDFQKSDAKQFKGKSDKKKKEMAVAAYLSKQND